MSENENKNLNIKKILLAAFALIILSFISFTAARAFSFEKTQDAASLTSEEAFDLTQFLLSNYPEEHQTLKKLPYNIGEPQLDIWAKSAILIDVSNGNILYQKNADSIIPPASMTKLFAMYVVEEEIAAGRSAYSSSTRKLGLQYAASQLTYVPWKRSACHNGRAFTWPFNLFWK